MNKNLNNIITRKSLPVIGRGEAWETMVAFPSGWKVTQFEDWVSFPNEGKIRKEVVNPTGNVVFTRTETFGYQAGDGSSEWGYEEEVTGNISAASLLRWAKSRFPEYIKGEKAF